MRLPRLGFRRLTSLAIALAFLTGCIAPLVRYLSRPAPEMMEQEKRKAAPRPDTLFAWDFPEKFDAYFRDAFGFRRSLVRTYTVAKVRGLGVSCNPQVVVGKKGWLFIDEHRSIDDYRGKVLFDDATLELWRISLEQRRDRLARRGHRLAVRLHPSKEEIYPEYLPGWLQAGHPIGSTNCWRISKRIRTCRSSTFAQLSWPRRIRASCTAAATRTGMTSALTSALAPSSKHCRLGSLPSSQCR